MEGLHKFRRVSRHSRGINGLLAQDRYYPITRPVGLGGGDENRWTKIVGRKTLCDYDCDYFPIARRPSPPSTGSGSRFVYLRITPDYVKAEGQSSAATAIPLQLEGKVKNVSSLQSSLQ